MPFTVLLVCTGNVCRSPMAELVLRALARPDAPLHVRSSGVRALVNQGIDAGSAAALARLGLDGSAHRARQFHPDQARQADLILTAERAHRDEILTEFARLAPTDSGLPPAEVVARAAAARAGSAATDPAGDDLRDPYRQGVGPALALLEVVDAAARRIVTALGFARDDVLGWRVVTGAARKIRVAGDPVLHAPCRQVTEFGDDLKSLIADMFASMAQAEGVGLAAPQIGVDLAVFVYDCPEEAGADGTAARRVGHVVNPTITTSGAPEIGDEGCLSVPGPYHELERASAATVRGVDWDGNPIEVSGTGFFARCLQHETDHLRGLLFIDHLPRNRRRRLLRDMEPYEWNAPVV